MPSTKYHTRATKPVVEMTGNCEESSFCPGSGGMTAVLRPPASPTYVLLEYCSAPPRDVRVYGNDMTPNVAYKSTSPLP